MIRQLRNVLGIILLMLGLTSTSYTQAAGADISPVETLRSYYADIYRADSRESSLDKPERIYAEPLLQLIHQEQRRQATSGELGELSADPLCSCQDPSAVELKTIRPLSFRKHIQRIQVELNVSGQKELITLHLVQQSEAWKVVDVSTRDIPSLKQRLQAGQSSRAHQAP